ncbi:MAG: hypothetical protein ABI794_15560 [Betaproteobacteria bacterium]
MKTWRWPHFVIVVLTLLLPGFAVAAEAEPATLQIYHRDIVTFRAPLTSHGMLLEGARRTRGILMQPEPMSCRRRFPTTTWNIVWWPWPDRKPRYCARKR